MKYVLDSSVAFKWVVPESDSPRAVQLRDEFRAGPCGVRALWGRALWGQTDLWALWGQTDLLVVSGKDTAALNGQGHPLS